MRLGLVGSSKSGVRGYEQIKNIILEHKFGFLSTIKNKNYLKVVVIVVGAYEGPMRGL